MAVTAVPTVMSGAINYTFTTDTSADFASVANSTYFFNKADKLVRYKDSTGAVLEIFSTSGGASGIFGITNSSGVYTYYTTLTLAMAAAVSGDVIEMFSDVTETGAVSITLKDGVNINGNGYTYTLNNSGLLSAFICPTTAGIKISILNLIAIRTGSTATTFDNAVIYSSSSGNGLINCSGSTFRNTGSGCGIVTLSGIEFINATCVANTDYGSLGSYNTAPTFTNCLGYSTIGVAIRMHSGGYANNCYGYSDSGVGIHSGYGGNIHSCNGASNSGTGIQSYSVVTNSTGKSVSGVGIELNNSGVGTNCSGYSVSGAGMLIYNIAYNCVGISSSSYGMRFGYGNIYNSISKSTSSASMFNTNGLTQLYNTIIISDWNNAVGYGIVGNGAGNFPYILSNCTFTLANTSAPYLFNYSAASAISMRGNTYKGGAAFNVNLTQAIVNTEDNQGNIYL